MGPDAFVNGEWCVEQVDASCECQGDRIAITESESGVSVKCQTNPAHDPQYEGGTYQPDPDPCAPGLIVGPGDPPSYTIKLTPAKYGSPARITCRFGAGQTIDTGSWTANDTSNLTTICPAPRSPAPSPVGVRVAGHHGQRPAGGVNCRQ